jgi:pimeloyl-ACP methyl ester carboxylesterase
VLREVPRRESSWIDPERVRIEYRVVHGYKRAYRIAGDGPALLLIHGIGDNSDTWSEVIPRLARTRTVIAPDLLGHGMSDKPRADYSIAAYANGMRDLLSLLEIDRATLVGHSLGGGVAMQFAYQFPERCERLVLVASGGAGRDVSPLLRACAVPGADLGLGALQTMPARRALDAVIGLLRHVDRGMAQDGADLKRIVDGLPDRQSRSAFIRTLRSVVDWRGQVVSALDRCYLTRGMPTLLMWGAHDSVLPVDHAYKAHTAMPGSRLEVFPDAGHFPFRSDPGRFVRELEEFCRTTNPATFSADEWRALLRAGRAGGRTETSQRDWPGESERSAT